MVYVSPSTLEWRSIVHTWLNNNMGKLFNEKQREYLWGLFDTHIDKTIELIRGK
jgi:hypothetical protein